jgi:hypothetical protein
MTDLYLSLVPTPVDSELATHVLARSPSLRVPDRIISEHLEDRPPIVAFSGQFGPL